MPTSPNDQINEAIETLLTYDSDPFIKDFLRNVGLPVGTPQAALRSLLPSILQGQDKNFSVKLETLVEHLDRLQESGRQCVFLFRWPESSDGTKLSQLREAGYVTRILKDHELERVFNSNIHVWEAESPKLAEVRHTPEALICKWVETRIWYEETPEEVDPSTRETTRKSLPRRERSITFFRINLSTGYSELLIQRLHSGAERPLRAEIGAYALLIKDLFHVDLLLTELEGPMRDLLLADSTSSHVKTWEVELPHKRRLKGSGGGPGFFRSLQLRLASFVPLFLEFLDTDASIRVKMHGRKDYFEITEPCLPKQHESILARIRRAALEPINDPDLQKVAETHPELRLPVRKIDSRMGQLKEATIRSHELVEEEWRDRERTNASMEAAQRQNPRKFKTTYYIRGPKGKRREFPDMASIPLEIEFKVNNRSHKVASANNIWVTLQTLEQPQQGIASDVRDGLWRTVLRKLDKSDLIDRVGNGLVLIVFAPFFALLGWWILSSVAKTFPDNTVLRNVSSVLALIIVVAMFVSVVGTKTFKAAKDVVLAVTRLFMPKHTQKDK